MALSTTKIDLNRSSTGVALPQSVAAEVLQGVTESSAVMQLSRRMTIPGPGVALDVITGDPEAAWVTAETAEQKVDAPRGRQQEDDSLHPGGHRPLLQPVQAR